MTRRKPTSGNGPANCWADRDASLKARHGLSYWDAAILAAAKLAGIPIVHSEDLTHGRDYDGVRVLNPFVWTS